MSMIRSMLCEALIVCSVLKTRCPVSAAVIVKLVVSRSRISPTMMMSGSCRRACRSPAAKVGQLLDDRRQVQIVDLEHLVRNHAERNSDRVPLEMGVDAEPVPPVDR